MKYSVAALSAVAAAALAQPVFLNSLFQPQEGQPFTLKFSGCDSGCSIVLQNGPKTNLKDVKALVSSVTGDSATITLEDLPSDVYTFKITDGSGQSNYSPQFDFQGSGSVSASASASHTASQRSSASASASASETTSSTDASSSSSASTTATEITSESVSESATETSETASSTALPSSTESSSTASSTFASSFTSAPSSTARTTSAPSTNRFSATGSPVTTATALGSAAGHLSSSIALVASVALAIAFFS